MSDNYKDEIEFLTEKLLAKVDESSRKTMRNLVGVQDRIYTQLESLSWLQKRLTIKGHLPPLRGWAASPDVLLKLHSHIIQTKPSLIIEFGSGSTTLVIADALRQNGIGHLVSVEHSRHYADQTLYTLQSENLTPWVDLRIGELEAWADEHMNSMPDKKPSMWYPKRLLNDMTCVDLILVDGPPGGTCEFARYPALPILFECLAARGEVWMDDTARQEEKSICQRWADDYDLDLEYFSLEKGLGILSPKK